MIRAVLDTNVLISGVIAPAGISSQILDAARDRRFLLVTSRAIVNEVLRTLQRSRIQRRYRLTAADVDRLRSLLEHESLLTVVTEVVEGVATHPEDDVILATAVSADADYLVTGDRQLQRLSKFRRVAIVSPRAFAAVLGLPGVADESHDNPESS